MAIVSRRKNKVNTNVELPPNPGAGAATEANVELPPNPGAGAATEANVELPPNPGAGTATEANVELPPNPGAKIELIMVCATKRDQYEPFQRIKIPVDQWTPVQLTSWITCQLRAKRLRRK